MRHTCKLSSIFGFDVWNIKVRNNIVVDRNVLPDQKPRIFRNLERVRIQNIVQFSIIFNLLEIHQASKQIEVADDPLPHILKIRLVPVATSVPKTSKLKNTISDIQWRQYGLLHWVKLLTKFWWCVAKLQFGCRLHLFPFIRNKTLIHALIFLLDRF